MHAALIDTPASTGEAGPQVVDGARRPRGTGASGVKTRRTPPQPQPSDSVASADASAVVSGCLLPIQRNARFLDKYVIVRLLGAGSFAKVSECVHRVTGDAFAVKMIRVSRKRRAHQSSSCTHSDAVGELRVCSALEGCPGVLQLREAFEEIDRDSGNGLVYAVFDLMRGGDLTKAVKLRGSLAEEDARGVMRSLFQACAGMHRRGVVHRDVKLDNILLHHRHVFDSGVRLVDMGLATAIEGRDSSVMHEACGTPQFMAPEILRVARERSDADAAGASSTASYGPEVDVWSCGVVLYNVLCGFPPFDSQDLRALLQQICSGKVSFSDPAWHMVTPEAIDLVKRCLTQDPASRITAEGALRHPWMLHA